MKEAFTYMFKDNKFLQKYLILFLLSFFDLLFTFFNENLSKTNNLKGIFYFSVLIFIISVIKSGYFINCVKSLTIQKENHVLPFLNVWSCIKKGFKLIISILLVSILLGLFYFAIIILFGLLFGKLLSLNIIFNVFFVISMTIFVLTVFYFSPALFWIFAQTEKIKSFLRLKAAYKIISFARKNYILYFFKTIFVSILTYIPFSVLFFIINIFAKHNITSYIFIIAFIGSIFITYGTFINYFILAKAIKPECVEMLN